MLQIHSVYNTSAFTYLFFAYFTIVEAGVKRSPSFARFPFSIRSLLSKTCAPQRAKILRRSRTKVGIVRTRQASALGKCHRHLYNWYNEAPRPPLAVFLHFHRRSSAFVSAFGISFDVIHSPRSLPPFSRIFALKLVERANCSFGRYRDELRGRGHADATKPGRAVENHPRVNHD